MIQTGTNTLPDFQQFALSPSSVVYDQGTNRCFAVCWNTASFDTSVSLGIRQITRIIPSSLAVDLTLDVTTMFGTGFQLYVFMQTGPGVLKTDGAGQIYGMGSLDFQGTATLWRFQANNPLGSNEFHKFGSEYLSFALATIAGDQRLYYNAIAAQDVEWWNFTSSANSNGPLDAAHNRLAIEYAPTQGNFYMTEEFQFIDVYDNGGNFLLQINTGRTAFNGVNIQRNPHTDLLYVAGGADGSVIVLNPAGNTFTVKLGFDLPYNFVFTPTKTFAVQAGSVGLKEVV